MTNFYPQNTTATGPRVLHVYHEGMIHRRTSILDSDKNTLLYSIEQNSGSLFSSKPHMTIRAGASTNVVGTITFHSISSAIDLVVHNQPIQLTSCGHFSSSHEFRSPSHGGATMKWKKDGILSGGDILCLDSNERVLARFDKNNWALAKSGRFEIVDPVLASGGRGLDELIVSGIAMLEYRRRKEAASGAGSGVATGMDGGAGGGAV
ncbi:MAG: hypothetical protein M1816_007178 [Peltula sp. TS41687]|nr:MAG: hypothetical protein M1816_007178 [Peltula sp. TS41687]